MIGILLALEYEIDFKFTNYNKTIINNQTFYLINDNYVLGFCGVGKVNAAICTTILLTNFKNIDNVINIGSCGSHNNNVGVLDLILVNKSSYGDVDVKIENKYEINQIPYEPKYFSSNPKLNNKLKLVLKQLNLKYYFGNFITIDSFVTSQNYHKFNELDNSVLGIDMELTSICQTCNHFNVGYSAIKIVSDTIFSLNNHKDYNKNMSLISKLIHEILICVINK